MFLNLHRSHVINIESSGVLGADSNTSLADQSGELVSISILLCGDSGVNSPTDIIKRLHAGALGAVGGAGNLLQDFGNSPASSFVSLMEVGK